MSILVDKNSRVVVQGITGSEGTFHSDQMIDYGTNIVAGVTPGKGGTDAVNGKIPVFNSVEEAVKETSADVSIIFVPPPFAADAIIEASEANIRLVVCITEGVPVHDMLKAKRIIDQNKTRLIGPNCPGIITVDECKLGIMPGFICKKGGIGVLSFENDEKTEGIVLIGEIGGQMENEAAKWIKSNMSKPVVGFIAGQTAPPGRRMGHAGAIVSGGNDTAEAKMKIMNDCGISVCESVAEIGEKMQKALNK